eukprot:TRINITY_DN6679_c0_g1_i1.p1 TRINITY_DN6679_c0_g1~~TRINITY_DN6679_c0_g1_i1.p1  ORF type:complete len:319 (+),score=60.28 TRINITY_DN6679_c0_g1_i1:80-1036(+)
MAAAGQLLSAVVSEVGTMPPGRVNEDRAIYAEFKTGCCGVWSMHAVVDGHGGTEAVVQVNHRLADVLRAAVDDAAKGLGGAAAAKEAASVDWVEPLRRSAAAHFREWDSHLRECSDRSGVCITAFLAPHDPPLRGLVVHLGDCRAVLSDGSGTGVKCLTRDHQITTNANEKARIRASGHAVSSGRVYGLEPTRTLGDGDVKAVAPDAVSHEPEVFAVPFELFSEGGKAAGAPRRALKRKVTPAGPVVPWVLLLATDGVWCSAKNSEATTTAARVLGKHGGRHPQAHREAASAVVQLARRRGSIDDVSVAVVTPRPDGA